VIEQYRDELITAMRESGVDPNANGSVIVAGELARGNWTSEDKEAVASDLLNVLHRFVSHTPPSSLIHG